MERITPLSKPKTALAPPTHSKVHPLPPGSHAGSLQPISPSNLRSRPSALSLLEQPEEPKAVRVTKEEVKEEVDPRESTLKKMKEILSKRKTELRLKLFRNRKRIHIFIFYVFCFIVLMLALAIMVLTSDEPSPLLALWQLLCAVIAVFTSLCGFYACRHESKGVSQFTCIMGLWLLGLLSYFTTQEVSSFDLHSLYCNKMMLGTTLLPDAASYDSVSKIIQACPMLTKESSTTVIILGFMMFIVGLTCLQSLVVMDVLQAEWFEKRSRLLEEEVSVEILQGGDKHKEKKAKKKNVAAAVSSPNSRPVSPNVNTFVTVAV